MTDIQKSKDLVLNVEINNQVPTFSQEIKNLKNQDIKLIPFTNIDSIEAYGKDLISYNIKSDLSSMIYLTDGNILKGIIKSINDNFIEFIDSKNVSIFYQRKLVKFYDDQNLDYLNYDVCDQGQDQINLIYSLSNLTVKNEMLLFDNTLVRKLQLNYLGLESIYFDKIKYIYSVTHNRRPYYAKSQSAMLAQSDNSLVQNLELSQMYDFDDCIQNGINNYNVAQSEVKQEFLNYLDVSTLNNGSSNFNTQLYLTNLSGDIILPGDIKVIKLNLTIYLNKVLEVGQSILLDYTVNPHLSLTKSEEVLSRSVKDDKTELKVKVTLLVKSSSDDKFILFLPRLDKSVSQHPISDSPIYSQIATDAESYVEYSISKGQTLKLEFEYTRYE